MTTFQDMALPEGLIHTLQHMNFTDPTPIQAEAIPLALEGRDILGSAQTGTGKTGAFGIPVVARLRTDDHGNALILTPTRELAAQVMVQLQAMLGKRSKIKTALLIGGDSMQKQLNQLRAKPRLVVGTPGRINDHLKRGSLRLDQTNFLVMDETDRMLDMGFSVQIEEILKHMAEVRQTLLFSATLPKNIVRLSEKYLNDPARVSVAATSSPAAKVKQDNLHVKEADKYPSLLNELERRTGSVIIFTKTKFGADRMAKKLTAEGHSADAIHGNLRQTKRDRVIAAFRAKKYRVLVATDVAARGLDIPHIEHVINYDLPQCPEDYIHRIGRTARAGADGEALNFIAPSDRGKWNAIDRLLNPDAERDEKPRPNKKRNFRGKPGRSGKPGGKPKMDGKPGRKHSGPKSGAKPKPNGQRRSKPKQRAA
ncbi:MAG: DEAD/DEAH box helicase [Planktomarina sp.]